MSQVRAKRTLRDRIRHDVVMREASSDWGIVVMLLTNTVLIVWENLYLPLLLSFDGPTETLIALRSRRGNGLLELFEVVH